MWARFDKRTKQVIPCDMNHAQLVLKYTEVIRA